MDLINDFKKVVKIFPILGTSTLREIQHRSCSKEWLIDIKRAISESTYFKINEQLNAALECTKNLIEYTPFNRDLMFAELEIKKNWNSYKITTESWAYLFSKSPDEIISLVREIACSSQKELIQKDYPFRFGKHQCIYKHQNDKEHIRLDKIKLLSNLKHHIYFYRDYKRSYNIYGKYYSKENYNLFSRFLDIFKNFSNIPSFGSIKKEMEKFIFTLENETIKDIQNGMEKLGKNVNGLPQWSTQNLDELVDNINSNISEILDRTSKSLIFPIDRKQNIKNTSGLHITNSILKKVFSLLEENYDLVGDYSPPFEIFLGKFKNLINGLSKADLVFKLAEQERNLDIKASAIFKKSQDAATIFHEAAEAFDIFAEELEACGKFTISKSWIRPDTKPGEIKTHKKSMEILGNKLSLLEKNYENLKSQIKQTNRENQSMNNSIERSEKRIIETSKSIKETSIACEAPLNFLEKLMKFFKINYISKNRKEQIEILKSLNFKYSSLENTIQNTKVRLKNNEEVLVKLNSQLKESKTNIVYLKKELNESTLKFSEEKGRILNAKELAKQLKSEATKISPKFVYRPNKHPWVHGIPKILGNCEPEADKIIKKVKNHLIKGDAETFEKNTQIYDSIGKSILSIIVETQAYSTIYLKNCEQNTPSKLLFKVYKSRIEIIKELDAKINKDRNRLADLMSETNEKKEKILLNIGLENM